MQEPPDSLYASKEEPGAPPPIFDVAGTSNDVVPDYEDSGGDGMVSASFWDSLSDINIMGKSVTPDTAKQIIYGMGATLIVLLLILGASLSGGGGEAAAGATGGGAGPARNRTAGPPLLIATVDFTAKITSGNDLPEVTGTRAVAAGDTCAVVAASASSCGGSNEARCSVTADGALVAEMVTSCSGQTACLSDAGPVVQGPPARHGCSRTPLDSRTGLFVECCVAVAKAGDITCPIQRISPWPACTGGG